MTDNKRTAAYENIFGRPSAQHHHHQHHPPTAPSPLQYSHSQAYRPPPAPPQPPYYLQGPQALQQQGYYLNPYEPRLSYAPSVASAGSPAAAPYGYPYGVSPSGYRGPSLTAEGYAPSSSGIVPDEDEGMTPAQAYQAQVYQQRYQGPPPGGRSPSPIPPGIDFPSEDDQDGEHAPL